MLFRSLNYKFFKVNPSVLDPIFGVAADSTWDTDQLLVNSYIGCYVAHLLSLQFLMMSMPIVIRANVALNIAMMVAPAPTVIMTFTV